MFGTIKVSLSVPAIQEAEHAVRMAVKTAFEAAREGWSTGKAEITAGEAADGIINAIEHLTRTVSRHTSSTLMEQLERATNGALTCRGISEHDGMTAPPSGMIQ